MDIPKIPDLSTLCLQVMTGPGELCVTFPGGVQLCASAGIETGDPGTIIKGMLAQIGAALMPLAPIFDVLDVVKALGDCVQAIPDCLGPLPSPVPILKCIPTLVKALEKVLQLLPMFSVPIMIKGILNVIITGLLGLRQKLAVMLKQVARIAAAIAAAARYSSGDGVGIGLQLQIAIDCAQSNIDAQLQNENMALMPLNRLIGLLNVFLKLIGLPCIPTLGGLGALTEEVLKPLDAVIKALQVVYSAIPVDLSLPSIPGPDEPC